MSSEPAQTLPPADRGLRPSCCCLCACVAAGVGVELWSRSPPTVAGPNLAPRILVR